MSGGVDSSVSAALLKKQGYDVTGVFIKVWQPDFLECTRGDDKKEAMRAAAHVGIPFRVFDFEKEYKKEVIDYMISEYKAGRTPNPDVMCNKEIKFGVFLKKALGMGADMIATGHYARTQNAKRKTQNIKLLAGKDKNKDQSYFLWTLAQGQLKHVLFPDGDYEKPKVRKLAKKFGLPNAERQESQGLCFVGQLDMKEFLKHYMRKKTGDVLNEKGDVIGRHDGAMFLTIGQRHGFTVTKKTPRDKPLYVVAKDVKKNTITVSPHGRGEHGLVKEVTLQGVNWISGTAPRPSKVYAARTRYRQPLQDVKIKMRNAKFIAVFKKPQRAVSSGQSLVLYDTSASLGAGGDECLGGGIIQ